MVAKVIDETPKVRRRMNTATIKSLNQGAAYIRGIARRSIGRGKKPSRPGSPPHSPTRRLKNAIYFSVDESRTAAVIGPTLSVVGRIGHTHEFGGTEPAKKSKRRRANFVMQVGGHGPIRATRGRVQGVAKLLSAAQLRRSQEIVEALKTPPWDLGVEQKSPRKYPPRPFMGPALTRSRDRIPDFWKNTLKGS